MPRSVRTNVALLQLPKGSGSETQRIEATNTTLTLTDDEWARVPSSVVSGGQLTDLGAVAGTGDGVSIQGTHVNAPAAITGAAAAGANPTKAEHDALVADVTALRATLVATLNALSGSGKALA